MKSKKTEYQKITLSIDKQTYAELQRHKDSINASAVLRDAIRKSFVSPKNICHWQIKCKHYGGCGLEFIILTWKKLGEQLHAKDITCPECGQKGKMLIMGREPSSQQIYEVAGTNPAVIQKMMAKKKLTKLEKAQLAPEIAP